MPRRARYLAPVPLNDRSTPLALILSRRSAKPRDMVGPGPTPAELETLLTAAARVPDHGKLAPWRFVLIGDRPRFADALEAAWRAENAVSEGVSLEKVRAFAQDGGALVAVLSTPVHGHKIPVWEQELSAGAACMTLVHAATAMGYGAAWLTGWAAYSPGVYRALGGEPGGRVAGFVFIGTPGQPLEERARPELQAVARRWGA